MKLTVCLMSGVHRQYRGAPCPPPLQPYPVLPIAGSVPWVEEFHLPARPLPRPVGRKSPALSSGAHRARYVIPYRIGGINRMVVESRCSIRARYFYARSAPWRCMILTVGVSDQRADQFIRLREVIEERASRKFLEEQAQADRPDPSIPVRLRRQNPLSRISAGVAAASGPEKKWATMPASKKPLLRRQNVSIRHCALRSNTPRI
jgi:hypothetical protein